MKITFKLNIDTLLKSDIFLLDLILFKKRQNCFVHGVDLSLAVFLDSLNLKEKFLFGLLRKVSSGLSCDLIDVVSSEVFVILFLDDFDKLFFSP
jgi:hypothetical protein